MKLFDKDWWLQQLHKEHIIELNELQVNKPNITVKELYKYCKENIIGNDNDFNIDSKGWIEYVEITKKYSNNQDFLLFRKDFETLTQSQCDALYRELKQLVQKYSSINELLVNKPKQYIPIIKPTKPEYITNVESFKKLSNYIENINLKLQKEIGRLNNRNMSETGGIRFPLTIDKASKIIFLRWFFENLHNFYEARHFEVFNKWWNESRICLEDLEEKNINELNINNPIDNLIINHKNQGAQGEQSFTDCRWYEKDGPIPGYPYKIAGTDESYWWNSDNGNHYNSKEALNILNNYKGYNGKLNELSINKPLKFPIRIPEQWEEKLIQDESEAEQLFKDFAKINPNLFKYINLLILNYHTYPTTVNLFLCSSISEAIWEYFDLNRYNSNTEWIHFNNLIVKQFNNRLIDFNEIESTFNLNKKLNESKQSIKDSFKEFIKFLQQELPIKEKYNIKLTKDKSKTTSFAHFNPSNNEIVVYIKGRNLMDSWRSLAHEWKHLHQNINKELTDNSGEDGSEHENEANAFAGLVMRKWGKLHPEYYTQLVESKINELEINNPNPSWEEIYDYYDENIYSNWKEFASNSKGWEEYEEIRNKYCEKYNLDLETRRLKILSKQDLNNFYSEMKQLVKKYVNINESQRENETFSAYHGRYKFDVSKAYNLIKQGDIKTKIKTYSPEVMHFLSHPEFSEANPKKYNQININYNEPLGLIANFKDENDKNELILIDGNHRTRKAVEEKQSGQYIVMYDPNDVNKILTINNEIPKKLFSDDE